MYSLGTRSTGKFLKVASTTGQCPVDTKMTTILVEIGSWRDRNLKIWPTNYHLKVDDLEKN